MVILGLQLFLQMAYTNTHNNYINKSPPFLQFYSNETKQKIPLAFWSSPRWALKLTFCASNSQTMIRPYLSFYWSNWPHLFIDICLYELFVLINVLGMEGERLISIVFCLFCIDFLCIKLPNHDKTISQLLLVQLAPSFP